VGALNRESLRLGEVETALERINSGNFGICVNCEEDVDANGSPRCRGPLAASPAKKLRIAWPATLRMWTIIRS
jgi:hypothetical protein